MAALGKKDSCFQTPCMDVSIPLWLSSTIQQAVRSLDSFVLQEGPPKA